MHKVMCVHKSNSLRKMTVEVPQLSETLRRKNKWLRFPVPNKHSGSVQRPQIKKPTWSQEEKEKRWRQRSAERFCPLSNAIN